MATIAAPNSLLFDFQVMLQALTTDQIFYCCGMTQEVKLCRNSLSKVTMEELNTLIPTLINLLKKAGDGIEALLHKISSLVMCKRYHQGQAAGKCKTWIERLPTRDSRLSEGGENAEGNVSLAFAEESLENVAPLPTEVAGQKTLADSNADLQTHAQATNIEPTQVYSDLDFDDSGFYSGDEEDSTENTIAPLGVLGVDEPSAFSITNKYTAPRTPQSRPPFPPTDSTDSAISMTFDETAQVAIRSEECPGSPLADKAKRRNQRPTNAKLSRRTPTSVQPKIVSAAEISRRGPTTPTPRIFESSSKWSPWENSKRLKTYIKNPLTPKAMEEGYIYCFQLDDCKYTKIGYAAHREGESSLQKSLDKRIKEHERCGWWNPTVVIHEKVPHVYRVEQIIHRHLAANKKDEVQMSKGSNGQKCKHKAHGEWFDVDFPKMYMALKAWKRWIETQPYIMLDGKLRLSPDWRKKLETVQVESSTDHWLEWLCRYVPEPVKLIREVGVMSMERDVKGDSLAIVKAGAMEDGRDDEKTIALNETKAPPAQFRPRASRTWPRKTECALGEKE